jgi:hypothetical protein
MLEKAGLPDIRFHDLRHSAATMLLTMGVHPKVVQEILGYSEISMTMDIYSHVLPTMQEDARDKLNQAFQRENSRPEAKILHDRKRPSARFESTPDRRSLSASPCFFSASSEITGVTEEAGDGPQKFGKNE